MLGWNEGKVEVGARHRSPGIHGLELLNALAFEMHGELKHGE
jgi:hypothetical protein